MTDYKPHLTKKVYICGQITGDPDYILTFFKAESELRRRGMAVMNPARLGEGFEHDEYMRICFPMIDVCDSVCLLPNYKKSRAGAPTELGYAMVKGKKIFNLASFLAMRPVNG